VVRAANVAAMLIGGALFGNTFYERADLFEVYSIVGGGSESDAQSHVSLVRGASRSRGREQHGDAAGRLRRIPQGGDRPTRDASGPDFRELGAHIFANTPGWDLR
jgi:hypothetical protein